MLWSLWAGNKNDGRFWVALAITIIVIIVIKIINVTVMFKMVFDNTYGCLECNNVKK